MTTPLLDLEDALASNPRRVIVVAGAGVASALCGGTPCSTWVGLLEEGLSYCEAHCGTSSEAIEGQRAILRTPGMPTVGFINVGEFIVQTLKSVRKGLLGKWLTSTIGQLRVVDPRLALALDSLGAKLVTTNYDDLIEATLKRQAVVWNDEQGLAEFLRTDAPAVLHVHGHYRAPASVVLGSVAYEKASRHRLLQSAMRSWTVEHTLLFVGCGAGLEDPNFGALLEWVKRYLGMCHHSHYLLTKRDDIESWRARLGSALIEPVAYGDEYNDLAPFLESLAARTTKRRDKADILDLLSSRQASFSSEWQTLELNVDHVSPFEFFNKSKLLAQRLWNSGGRRRAAIAFSDLVSKYGHRLSPDEFASFALDAVEWLLEDEQVELAAQQLNKVAALLDDERGRERVTERFHRLRTLYMQRAQSFDDAVAAIDAALPLADLDARERLLAERLEIQFLQGNLPGAEDGE